jgi:hypothetical protein
MLEQILEHVATACHDPATSSQPSPRRPTDRPRNPHAPPQLMLRHPRRVNPNRIPTTRRQVHLQDRPPPHSLAPNHRMRRVLIRIRCIRIDFRRITPVPEERQRHLQIPRLPVRNRPHIPVVPMLPRHRDPLHPPPAQQMRIVPRRRHLADKLEVFLPLPYRPSLQKRSRHTFSPPARAWPGMRRTLGTWLHRSHPRRTNRRVNHRQGRMPQPLTAAHRTSRNTQSLTHVIPSEVGSK